jgi:hypothetical protein
MANLKIGQEDIRESESLGYEIEEVLMQIEGDFFKFDTQLRQNVLVRAGIFLSIQKVKDKNAIGGLFLLNVHDLSNKVSFTCQELQADNQFQFDPDRQIVMWVGAVRPTGEIPAWSFKVKQ